MSSIVCMRCGALLRPESAHPGRVAESGAEAVAALRCRECGTVHASEANPTPSNRPLLATEPVVAEWGGRWWRAELVEQTQTTPERWRVRFVGWSDEFVQELGRDRVQEFGGGAPVRRWKLVLVFVGIALLGAVTVLLANKGKLVSSNATTVELGTQLEVGQPVEVERDNRWVAAEVLAVGDDGRVLVRYLDLGPMGDEWVDRVRLRLP